MEKGMYVCDHCHSTNEFDVTEYVNAQQNPQLKEKLIEGKLFLQHCHRCGSENIVVSSMLYEDDDLHYFVEMVPAGDTETGKKLERKYLSKETQKNAGAYQKRVVHEPNDLLEKIAVFEEGLDDRVIEIMKLSAAAAILNHQKIDVSGMYFSPSEKGREFDVLVKNEFYGTIPFQQKLYDQIRDSYLPLLNSHEASAALVDMDWALEVIRSKKGMRA